jgi:hypothetical protein
MATHRRFLVVVRAGDSSLHPQWTTEPDGRDWDLVVSYFGDDPSRFRNAGEVRVDGKGQKYPGLHDLFERDDFWRGYDYVWLPDDDLAVGQADLSGFFRRVADLDLALAQPALSWTSYYSHPVTLRHPSFSVRMTNFVEIMAPCFERRFLETCLPTFRENLSGWGLDWLWPTLLAGDQRRCAIVDEVVITHTRPVGGPAYDKLREIGINPFDELALLMRRHGIAPGIRPTVKAALDRRGHLLDGSRPADAAVLEELLARDWAAFQAARPGQNGMDAASSSTSAASPIFSPRCASRARR